MIITDTAKAYIEKVIKEQGANGLRLFFEGMG